MIPVKISFAADMQFFQICVVESMSSESGCRADLYLDGSAVQHHLELQKPTAALLKRTGSTNQLR